jgi:hypothetical protein
MTMTMTQTAVYRVVRSTSTGFVDPKVQSKTIWQGSNTDQLSMQYPPSTIFGADPLGRKEIEGGYIRITCEFQRQTDDGTWETCDDPRRRLTASTALEREIDADNRRQFPGDYGDADDDQDVQDDHGGDPHPQYHCDDCLDTGCSRCYNCTECFDDGCDLCDTRPLCCCCQKTRVDNKDDYCDDCRQLVEHDYASGCCACGKAITGSDSDSLCQSCQDHVDKYY